jgi:hypothetical protein
MNLLVNLKTVRIFAATKDASRRREKQRPEA